eukprot:CAMPEP_0183718176 /NCGR_PEP_ID=MMETSP0737-20130205/11507_1 /TAXON_ID=385413 /ORGANISM="Thalassiosira miniscula, Strain CCMP1093" /LENGTH=369 /DNA_ID=CAMNT_0025947691 /DNA_START=203 /DNA_END=1313 /DNA_ORIENTATION=+
MATKRGGGNNKTNVAGSLSDANANGDSSSSTPTTVASTANGSDNELIQLKKENQLLQERLKLLQIQNDQLLQQLPTEEEQTQTQKQQQRLVEQRIILEDFEREGLPQLDARGGVVDGWNQREKKYTEPWDEAAAATKLEDDEDDELGLSSSSAEDEVCEYDSTTNKWFGTTGECPVEPNVTFLDAMKSRAYWLVGLLALQSCSGFILSRNELLLQDHPVIVYFLTMLVGAGGNAGNQASVRVIRGLALGTLNPQTQSQFLSRELRMACALSVILSVAGFLRATLFQTPFPETLAVTMALSMIVFSSICLGAVLPLLLQKCGVDPAHSSTTIQVVMDILGVVLTVLVSTLVLDSGWGKMLISAVGKTMGI